MFEFTIFSRAKKIIRLNRDSNSKLSLVSVDILNNGNRPTEVHDAAIRSVSISVALAGRRIDRGDWTKVELERRFDCRKGSFKYYVISFRGSRQR